jgi:hypothetical protein
VSIQCKHPIPALLCLVLFLFAAAPGRATTIVKMSDQDLVQSARAIVVADVQSLSSRWSEGNVYTHVELKVREAWAGPFRTGDTIVVRQLGGTVGAVTQALAGSPGFRTGERAVLFLDTWSDGALRVAHLSLGKYDLSKEKKTGRLRVERKVDDSEVRLIEGISPRRATEAASLSALRRAVRGILSDPVVRADMEIRWQGEPILARPPELGERPRGGIQNVTERFELLLGDGRFRRWFQPDRGQAVVFRPNPANAPVADFRTRIDQALATWSNAPLNNLIFNNASPSREAISNLLLLRGADTASAGFFTSSTDRVSAISFNDPRNQLSDPVNCGGIVAGASYMLFNNNEARTIRGLTFFGLSEADVVFNNGWTTATCGLLLDPVTVEEVTLHEIGHAIGFNHSLAANKPPGDDPAMRATVFANGRGAKLAMDDLDGVGFLYPRASNPIDEATYFVGAHYRDFLERQPDFPGWNFWTRNITDCAGCSVAAKRIDVARAFFFSGEFIDLEQSQDPHGRRRLADSNRNTPDYNEAFVDAAYRRYWKIQRPASDPWVAYLNSGIPNADYNGVINAFITDFLYRGRFTGCRMPIEEQSCNDQGGSWSQSSCTCQFSCDPTGELEQRCNLQGGFWDPFTCSCEPGCGPFNCF